MAVFSLLEAARNIFGMPTWCSNHRWKLICRLQLEMSSVSEEVSIRNNGCSSAGPSQTASMPRSFFVALVSAYQYFRIFHFHLLFHWTAT